MIDIIPTAPGLDMGLYDTQTERAANILDTQLGALEYAPDFGVDLSYFLQTDFKFQNESFKSYCIQVLANEGINVSSVDEILASLYEVLGFNLAPAETTTGLITG